MKQLKFAWLLVVVLVLAACGQQQMPEVAPGEDVQPLSDLTSSSSLGGSSANAVSLKPSTCDEGSSQQVTITYSITGNQGGTSTFQVPTVWTYNGTAWTSGTLVTVSVPERKNGDAATVRTVDVTVTNSSSRNSGSSSFTITPSNPTNQKSPNLNLSGGTSTIHVAFNACPVSNTAPWLNVPDDFTAEATSGSGAVVNFSNLVTAGDAEDTSVSAVCTLSSGSTFALGENTVNCSVTDSGGLSTQDSFKITVQDTTAPVISGMPSNQTLEATGPRGAVATWTAPTANDAVDGSVTVACSHASGSTFALGTSTVTCSAADSRGNSDSKSFTITVGDTTPPTISWNSAINDGDSFYFGGVPAAPTCTASDLVAGTVSCTVTGYRTAVGSHTLTASATDGTNPASETRSYTVLAWTLSGFYSPLSSLEGVLNTAKAGSTVPMKFNVHAGSVEQTATSAITSFRTVKIACDAGAGEDAVDFVTTGGTSLRYDSTAGQFIQNWQTPKTTGCYRTTLTTQDGSTLQALFRLR